MFMLQQGITIILCFILLILAGWEARAIWIQAEKILQEDEGDGQ